jgi:acyl dehydratase
MKIKTFSYKDQHKFAEFSRDYNLLHLDEVASRRFTETKPNGKWGVYLF